MGMDGNWTFGGDHTVVYQFSSVQSLSHVRLFVTSWTTACQDSLSITNSWSLPVVYTDVQLSCCAPETYVCEK